MDRPFYVDDSGSYSHLTLGDLVEARDQYHIHLMRHKNVVATALGYYRIRKDDSWPNVPETKRRKGIYARTLANSEVRPYSWPCVMVFVDEWVDQAAFQVKGQFKPQDMVPPVLYLSDGRKVPVCVLLAPKAPASPSIAPRVRYPLNNIGGGWPVLADVQGQEHVATIACLVRDGHKVYALTNRHVAGDVGEILSARLDGVKARIGVADERQLTRVPFTELYNGLTGRDTMVNMDVGLIEVDDLESWTAEVRGIGQLGPMVDISSGNLSLRLIGSLVRGQGAGSGLVKGEVQALFYRYQSRAGSDHIADVLIGPRTHVQGKEEAEFTTLPGDSGRLFVLEQPDETDKTKTVFHPLAVQWGAQYLAGDKGDSARGYALATFVSTLCERLDVDIVRDWNLDQPNTWGAVGHFSIATCMAGAISDDSPKLKKLLENHEAIISHPRETIEDEDQDFDGMGDADFVPMADVPDFYWKHGKQGGSRRFEGSNHFADLDHPRQGDGKTLLELSKANAIKLDPDEWDSFLDDVRKEDGKVIASDRRGLLPFRVWQIVDEMIAFAGKKEDHDKFICSAGVIAHYCGDACQPLHMSYMFDGDPGNLVGGPRGGKPKPLGSGVHHAYEAAMFNGHRTDLISALDKVKPVKESELISSGAEAGRQLFELMTETMELLPPKDLTDTYVEGKRNGDGISPLWDTYGKATLKQMTKSVHLLAAFVESAWVAGGGEAKATTALKITEKEAMAICKDQSFLQSYKLKEIGAVLKKE